MVVCRMCLSDKVELLQFLTKIRMLSLPKPLKSPGLSGIIATSNLTKCQATQAYKTPFPLIITVCATKICTRIALCLDSLWHSSGLFYLYIYIYIYIYICWWLHFLNRIDFNPSMDTKSLIQWFLIPTLLKHVSRKLNKWRLDWGIC